MINLKSRFSTSAKKIRHRVASRQSCISLRASQPLKDIEANLIPIEYSLETFHRSNQDTCLVHKPAVLEGDWVETGDLLADCSASIGGELSLGHNILIAYMPWEGFNYEDAILISERLVYDDVYTSVHIERYETDIRETKYGKEKITKEIPDVSEKEIKHLNTNGVSKIGTWIEEGDILVGKITPINKKSQSPYQKLLYTILEKEFIPYKDNSLRAPKGIKAKVVNVYTLGAKESAPKKLSDYEQYNKKRRSETPARLKRDMQHLQETSFEGTESHLLPQKKSTFRAFVPLEPQENTALLRSRGVHVSEKKGYLGSSNLLALRDGTKKHLGTSFDNFPRHFLREPHSKVQGFLPAEQSSRDAAHLSAASISRDSLHLWRDELLSLSNNNKGKKLQTKSERRTDLHSKRSSINLKIDKKKQTRDKKASFRWCIFDLIKETGATLSTTQLSHIQIYLAEKRKIQIGDKMAGRHGNKGIVSQILPRQDMPYLPDGTPVDMVLNPLGVPSRMNVGQIYECLLGLAGKYLGTNFRVFPFDEIYGAEASRSFVFSKLYEARKKTGNDWLFDPNFPGKTRLFDGRSGECFDQPVTVGQSYMLKLVHLVDDKIHSRSTGPYSLVTQQPLRGRSKQGGQRLGEMEVWALEGYGAAFILLEMLTIKSDNISGRLTLWSNLILNRKISIGTPESFKVLVSELQALCLNIGLYS